MRNKKQGHLTRGYCTKIYLQFSARNITTKVPNNINHEPIKL